MLQGRLSAATAEVLLGNAEGKSEPLKSMLNKAGSAGAAPKTGRMDEIRCIAKQFTPKRQHVVETVGPTTEDKEIGGAMRSFGGTLVHLSTKEIRGELVYKYQALLEGNIRCHESDA